MCVVQKFSAVTLEISSAVPPFKKNSSPTNFAKEVSSKNLDLTNLGRKMFFKAAMLVAASVLYVVVFASMAVAQPYEIMRADYGAGSQRRDVTSQFRSAVCSQTRFRMGNSTFGCDPAPGSKKSLRVYVRGARGRETMQEFPESSTIDGSMYVCGSGNWNGGGNWNNGQGNGGGSGQYTIMHAEYGTERNHVDVTNRLRELAQANRTFRMGNSTFNVDPDPGHIKTLRIYARDMNGQARTFDYRESSTIDGAQFAGWGSGNWGNGGWNGGWGGWDNGGGSDAGQYYILHAEYGTERNHVDVTDRLRELARSDRTFRMGNSSFGTDPDPGHIKTLRIYARGQDGRKRMFEYRESSTIDGAQFAGWGGGDWGGEGWNGHWNGDDDRR